MRMRFSLCVSAECVPLLGYRHTQRSRRAVFFLFQKQSLSIASAEKCSTVCMQAVQHQRFNGSRVPSSRLWASHGVCVCGWCTAAGGDRTTATFARSMLQRNTRLRTSHFGPRTRYTKHKEVAKKTAAHIHIVLERPYWNGRVPLLDSRRPRYIKETPSPRGLRTRRTDNRFLLNDLDISGNLQDLSHVTWWEP